jgi:hypothetical protein
MAFYDFRHLPYLTIPVENALKCLSSNYHEVLFKNIDRYVDIDIYVNTDVFVGDIEKIQAQVKCIKLCMSVCERKREGERKRRRKEGKERGRERENGRHYYLDGFKFLGA